MKENKKKEKNKEFIYGINSIQVLLNIDPSRVIEIFCEKKDHSVINPKIKTICDIAAKSQISIQYVRGNVLDKWFDEEVNHQGIVAHIKPKNFLTEEDLIDLINQIDNSLRPVFLVLDNIQDPRNLGACIRSAASFKVSAVIISRNATCGITSTVKKVASGGVEVVPIAIVGNLVTCLKMLQKQGVWIVTLDAENASNLSSIDLTIPIALVLGSEHLGVRELIKKNSDFLAKIPMADNSVDSLNLGVAAGICLYEVARQRGF